MNTPLIEEDNAPDTYVKKSSIHGFGLFASKKFVKDELIIDMVYFQIIGIKQLTINYPNIKLKIADML
jgi:hypothetical protein